MLLLMYGCGLRVSEVVGLLKDEGFHILEAEHPALCADRIDYTLRDLLAWDKISQTEAQLFINSLVFIHCYQLVGK